MSEAFNNVQVTKTDALDPNKVQRQASSPDDCVWVGASAGTGKTKVLTDRVLRLLLPRDDGRPGTPPHKVLCLTFTKAAANEMALRIQGILAKWAVIDRTRLFDLIADLVGHEPSDLQLDAAQKLFANVVDSPSGLQIMTIHSFCQSVLGRFPIEAGLSPSFKLMDDAQQHSTISQAIQDVLCEGQSTEMSDSPLAQALHNLVGKLDEDRFMSIIRGMTAERNQMRRLFEKYNSVDMVHVHICELYSIDTHSAVPDIVHDLCRNIPPAQVDSLKKIAQEMLQDKSKRSQDNALNIIQWLNFSVEDRITYINDYKSAYLTSKGVVKSDRGQGLPAASVLKTLPNARDILCEEAQRLIDADDKVKCISSARLTRDLLHIGNEILQRYAQKKEALGILDFDDLILRTMTLLKGQSMSFKGLTPANAEKVPDWIMYKLDQGLDHILVDEAQDTNPEQWSIIESLSDEFFSGHSARDDITRTSFVVGDIKQSIYSFQRAAPAEFKRMHSAFDEKIQSAGLLHHNIGLDISFRTTKSVLRIVDNVFGEDNRAKAVGELNIHHKSFRAGQAGLVELWPIFADDEKVQRDFWDPPIEVKTHKSGASQLADFIAKKIRYSLDSKEILQSADRPVSAGDYMILVRSRTKFVDQMVRALKVNNVPVSGVDRMILGEQLAVQDLLSMARFCLLADDDLALAEILKSPFLGWTEEELFSLAYNRRGTLWQELCNFDHDKLSGLDQLFFVLPSKEKCHKTWDYLSRMIGRVGHLGAYDFFSNILNLPCPADECSGLRAVRGRLGVEALDAIDELLNAALDFGRENVDHLQVFLDYQEKRDIEIKRELDESTGQVRIMTIHGSKGLQAPIVILPDTMKGKASKSKAPRLLWPDKTEMPVPFYAARQDEEPTLYKDLHQKIMDLSAEEELRLLYVAMTRAADRLYISGYRGKNDPDENSWYYCIRQAMQEDESCVDLEDGLRIENEQSSPPDRVKLMTDKDDVLYSLPLWVSESAPQEPVPSRPLTPSKPSIEESEVAVSPLEVMNENRFRRGNVTHKLLQFLPDFPLEKRRFVANKFIAKLAVDLSVSVQQNIVDEVMSIFENEDFASFFSEHSIAEVSLAGLVSDNRIVSGQIDRLVVSDDEVWIVDYKTNRPPPEKVEDVPMVYKKQIYAYKETIKAIYPNHRIHCALLWTDGPRLMRID